MVQVTWIWKLASPFLLFCLLIMFTVWCFNCLRRSNLELLFLFCRSIPSLHGCVFASQGCGGLKVKETSLCPEGHPRPAGQIWVAEVKGNACPSLISTNEVPLSNPSEAFFTALVDWGAFQLILDVRCKCKQPSRVEEVSVNHVTTPH